MQLLLTHWTKSRPGHTVYALPQGTKNLTACETNLWPVTRKYSSGQKNKSETCSLYSSPDKPVLNFNKAKKKKKKSYKTESLAFPHWLQRNWPLNRTEREATAAANRGFNPGACHAICPLSLVQQPDHFTSAKLSLIRANDCPMATP